ncbi:MAG: hypothetical protein ACR2L6_03765 [Gemmatimonadaceae bacterium]
MVVVFPGSDEPALTRANVLAAGSPVAAACATPDSISFTVESRCRGLDQRSLATGRQLLIVSNWSEAGYRPDILRALMPLPEARRRFASQVAALADSAGRGGIVLDFRALGPRDVDALVALVTAVADSARGRNVAPVIMVVPAADTAAYPGRHLGAVTDLLAVRLELEPASPGPSAPRNRMSRLVGARAAEIGAHRVMLLIPADGFMWRGGEPRSRVSFEQAVATARDWGVDFVRDESSATLRARAPGRGEIWVNDAVLIAGIVRDARRLGIRKFALYGLGGEDTAIWSAIAAEPAVTR